MKAAILLLFIVHTAAVVDSSAADPQRTQNEVVVRGGKFHLKCASANPVCGALQWTKRGLWGGEEAISYGRSLMGGFGGRYAMNASGVPCDVMVNDVTLSDAGEFACVSPDSGRQSAQLTVLESPPDCWHDANSTEVLEGETVRVHCGLRGYSSPGEPRLDWVDSHHQAVLTAAVTHRPGAINSTFLLVAQSPAVYPFTCRIAFESPVQRLGAARNVPDIACSTELLQVVYPVRDIRLKMNGTRLTAGKIVTCSADGEPSPSYRWVTVTTGDVRHGDTVTVETGHVYQCVASNTIRGVVYQEKSWEIYVREDRPKKSGSKGTSQAPPPTETSLSTSSSLSVTRSSPLLLADQPQNFDLYEYDDMPNKKDEVTHRVDDVTQRPITSHSRDNTLSISSIVLGVLLLVSLIVILIILVHMCGLRDKLKEMETRKQATPYSSSTAHSVMPTEVQHRRDVEKHDSTKSLLSETGDNKQVQRPNAVQ